jgi:non-heme chloroperoxidase
MPRIGVEPGVSLFVADLDPGPSRRGTVLLIHGWPASHRMWEFQLTDLPARGLRCVAPDLRGFGASDRPWQCGYDVWADDVQRVVERMGLSDVTLAGFSMGGAIAMRFMAKHGGGAGPVSRLALLAAAGPRMQRAPDNPAGAPREQYDGLIAGLRADRPKTLAGFGQAFFGAPPSPELGAFMGSIAWEASPWATIKGAEELRDADQRDTLPSIRVPTPICHGRRDAIVPFALGEAQAEAIPGARLVPFESSGHALFAEEAAKLNGELAGFAAGGG